PQTVLWSDENWVLRGFDKPSGLPVVVLLETRRHVDFPDLDDQLAAELGPLLLQIQRAVSQVPGVGNVHVGRWGEGSEHCHIWFMARPARMTQFRSSFAAIWDDVLPPIPEDVWREHLEHARGADVPRLDAAEDAVQTQSLEGEREQWPCGLGRVATALVERVDDEADLALLVELAGPEQRDVGDRVAAFT